jgi:meso-butanediol dehydrogenase/(S,S)-butanediol dehydrogenase/diacetyl reductase
VVGCDIRPVDGSDSIDVTDEDAVRRWVDAAAEEHGRIDVLYANGGATRFGPLEAITRLSVLAR